MVSGTAGAQPEAELRRAQASAAAATLAATQPIAGVYCSRTVRARATAAAFGVAIPLPGLDEVHLGSSEGPAIRPPWPGPRRCCTRGCSAT